MLGLWAKGGFRKYWKETLYLYDDMYFSRSIKDISELGRRLPHDPTQIGLDFVGTYDGERVTFYYIVQALPKELLIDFKDKLRRETKSGVRVNFLNYIRGHKIDWNSSQMRNRLRVLEQVGSENNSQNVNSYNMHENITTLGKQDWIESSLEYLSLADIRRGRSLLRTSMLVTISGYRGEDFDDSIKIVEDYARDMGITLSRVLYNIPEVLKYFSPFSRPANKHMLRNFSTQVLTDEILARYNTYAQGTLGVRGVYFGTDVYSRFPVLKRVKPKPDIAENWLITAETGGGKSHTVKDLLLQLLSLNYNGTIMDIEGFEYLPIADFMNLSTKTIVLNMAEGSGSYLDPVEISAMTGIEDIDKDAKNMSINFTLAIYKTLLGRTYLEDTWVGTVLNDAVGMTYTQAGVTEDRSTWVNSKDLTLFDVFDNFFVLKDKPLSDDAGYRTAVEKIISTTRKYFEPDGTRSSVFSERVVVSDIIDARLVVCSFGMAGKSPQAIDEVQLALMQLSAAQLSHQRSIFSKSQGRFNFKIWEEFQRWGKFPDSDKTIGVAVTGGRKLGDVNIILTNDVAQILADDRFGILSNITSFMIGAIADEKVRGEICSRLSIPHMKPELDLIATAQRIQDEEGDSDSHKSDTPLAFAFLAGLDKNKFGIVRMVNPPEITNSDLYKTGVDLKEEVPFVDNPISLVKEDEAV